MRAELYGMPQQLKMQGLPSRLLLQYHNKPLRILQHIGLHLMQRNILHQLHTWQLPRERQLRIDWGQ